MITYLDIEGFDWDERNSLHNVYKFKTFQRESEEVFKNNPIIFATCNNTRNEERILAYGKTNSKKLLTVVFTIRCRKIRIIAARPQSNSEKILYNEESAKDIKENPFLQKRKI